MGSCFDPALPVVVIYNNLETFYPFLRRAANPELLQRRHTCGDQALFWLGADKLVFASILAPHAAYVRQDLGYPGTHNVAPRVPTPWLSNDIQADPLLLDQLVAYAGAGRTIQLIPYATTQEFLRLVAWLRSDCSLRVLLPESPAPEALWVRDRMDTKSGFRAWASQWLPDGARQLPRGEFCEDPQQAAAAAARFCRDGVACVIKPDIGAGGVGQLLVRPGEYAETGPLLQRLLSEPYLQKGTVVVEQWIDSPDVLAPSLEFCVPPTGAGEPAGLYLCEQVFLSSGEFEGVLIDRSSLDAPWYPAMKADGLRIARQLQGLGYAGYFDLDGIVDADGRLYLLEVNARRTGGTYAHDFARLQFGDDYVQRVSILALNQLSSGSITSWPELRSLLSDLLYPCGGEQQGVVVTITSPLAYGEFGCLIVAGSRSEALTLYAEIDRRVRLAGSGHNTPIRPPAPRQAYAVTGHDDGGHVE